MITFFNAVGTGLNPQKADKAVNGTLPTNGFRYCEPVRTASGFGWYVFLPLEFWVEWDGTEYHWTIDGGENWYLLADAIQYPNFSSDFDAAAPESVQGYSPPFLSRTNDGDILQLWTGQFARTKPGIATYVKGPTNYPNGQAYSIMEGVIQTEWWFGPLFTNVRVHRQGKPIVFRADRPIIQLMPFSNALFEEFEASKHDTHVGLEGLGPDEWSAYEDTVVRRMKTRKRMGDYAVEARQHRKRQSADHT